MNTLLDKEGRDAMFKDMADSFNEAVEKEQALDLKQPIKLSAEAEEQMQENVRKLEEKMINELKINIYGDLINVNNPSGEFAVTVGKPEYKEAQLAMNKQARDLLDNMKIVNPCADWYERVMK